MSDTFIENLFARKMTRRGSFLAIGFLLTSCAKMPKEEPPNEPENKQETKPVKKKNKSLDQLYAEGSNCGDAPFCRAHAVLYRLEENEKPVRDLITGEDLYAGYITDKSATLRDPSMKHRLYLFNDRALNLNEIAVNQPRILKDKVFDSTDQAQKFLDKMSAMAKTKPEPHPPTTVIEAKLEKINAANNDAQTFSPYPENISPQNLLAPSYNTNKTAQSTANGPR